MGDTVIATSTRPFVGRVVEGSKDQKSGAPLALTPAVVLATILGRTPLIEEYNKPRIPTIRPA